ncbi:MAG: hypothetical protein AB1611_10920 [bacterium]
MQTFTASIHHVLSFLFYGIFFVLWVAFPIWFGIRRRQGLIQIGNRDDNGSERRMVDYLELGIFFFAIPFTSFFIIVTANLLLSPFIAEPLARREASIEVSSLVMDVALILYIILAERKIRLDRTGK